MFRRKLKILTIKFFFLAPPPLSIRDTFEGNSPNSSPLWLANHSTSSINTSYSSNGIQNSPSLKGPSASPIHLSNPQAHQSLRHPSLTSPTSTTSQNLCSNNNSDLIQQKGSATTRAQHNSGTKVSSPLHQSSQRNHHRADHFTFSPNHISAESSATQISYHGHSGSGHYSCNENFMSPPGPSATSPPCKMPMPSHMSKGSQQPRIPSQHQSSSYTASSPVKTASPHDNK